MFLTQYILCTLYFILLYKISRSERSFNNWLYDYILARPASSKVKINGIMYLLLSFEDASDIDSIMTCLSAFKREISDNQRLAKIAKRLE